ncbi:MAG TPA: hypothetical protein IGR64_16245 [Leptolyngbyaceae cyanobacterium M65_K2018_010]|nr:hypothetical protein [Leptolyngbyaceae cyanobacterium M65_K2018_010]
MDTFSGKDKGAASIWGFTRDAENLNGRLAMLGFTLAIVIEMASGQGVLHFLNLV